MTTRHEATRHEVTRYAVLLRGINVGRAKQVGMADLRTLLTGQGHDNVRTLLRSGNVVLDSDRPRARLRTAIERAIEERFGFGVDVILRDHAELAEVVARNPLREVADDGARHLVAFHATAPADGALDAALAGVDLRDDRYATHGCETYLWCPRGQADSPLMTALGRLRGGPSTTVRNWNTVGKLLALMDRQ